MLAPRALCPFQGGGTGDGAPFWKVKEFYIFRVVLPEIDDSSTLWGAPASKCRTVVDFWKHHPENVELFYFLQIFVGTEEKEEKKKKKKKTKKKTKKKKKKKQKKKKKKKKKKKEQWNAWDD